MSNHATSVEKSSRYRIAYLVQGNEGFGVGRAVVSLAGELHRRGHDVRIVSLDDGKLADQCEAMGMAVTRVKLGMVPGLSGGVMDKVRQMARLRRYERRVRQPLYEALRAIQPDVLHFLWPNLVAVAGRAARALGVPAFWEMPNIVSDRLPLGVNRRWYQWQCKRFAIQPLANSAYTAASLGDWLVKPIVFHLGADPSVFDPEKVEPVSRSALNIPPAATVLGIVARLDPSKGQNRVLEAMLRLTAEGQDLHLLLIGGPTDTPYAERLRAMGGERVHLAGTVSDPQRYYGAMDVAVNSRVDAEPFGLSVIEAMMMGKPVLVHALGGPAETVVDGRTGWHVAEASVEAFEAGLRRALADRGRWADMGQAARQRALDAFSTAVVAQRYEAAVGEQLSG